MSAVAPSVIGIPAPRAFAQSANHEGGHTGDGIRCSSGKPETAIVACTSIINDRHENDCNHLIALRNRAVYFSEQGDLDQAIADFTAALKLSWDKGLTAKVYVNRGLVYARKGNGAAALADYSQAIVLDPGLPSGDLAIADFTAALAIDPNQSAVYVDRGQAFEAQHDRDRAIADFSEAIRIDPQALIAYRQRAFYRLEGGDQSGGD